MMKSPLRYPGGKSQAVKWLAALVPDASPICSPFFGGGSFELAMVSRGVQVYGFDHFQPLVDFWECALKNPKKLADKVRTEYFGSMTKERYKELQRTCETQKDVWDRAAMFYVINRCSFSGAFSGGMSLKTERFTASALRDLEGFLGGRSNIKLTVRGMDFRDSIWKSKDLRLFCDPPYMNDQKLYADDNNKDFDHLRLANMLNERDNWILCYNDTPRVRFLYRDHVFHTPSWKYGMSNGKKAKEVVITSNDIRAKLDSRWF